jgi:hypothetical protein
MTSHAIAVAHLFRQVRRWADDAVVINITSAPDAHGMFHVLAHGTLTKSIPSRRAYIVLSMHEQGGTSRFQSWAGLAEARTDYFQRSR